ncbi:hypothetical protein AZA_66964 [Nitrospirillum viridazoti Y2]|nr:hypothetical protein AZA_66964 [Nitrospirillum amazonense Y2]
MLHRQPAGGRRRRRQGGDGDGQASRLPRSVGMQRGVDDQVGQNLAERPGIGVQHQAGRAVYGQHMAWPLPLRAQADGDFLQVRLQRQHPAFVAGLVDGDVLEALHQAGGAPRVDGHQVGRLFHQIQEIHQRRPARRTIGEIIAEFPQAVGQEGGGGIADAHRRVQLVRHPGHQFAQRGQLFRLHQALLGVAQFLQRPRGFGMGPRRFLLMAVAFGDVVVDGHPAQSRHAVAAELDDAPILAADVDGAAALRPLSIRPALGPIAQQLPLHQQLPLLLTGGQLRRAGGLQGQQPAQPRHGGDRLGIELGGVQPDGVVITPAGLPAGKVRHVGIGADDLIRGAADGRPVATPHHEIEALVHHHEAARHRLHGGAEDGGLAPQLLLHQAAIGDVAVAQHDAAAGDAFLHRAIPAVADQPLAGDTALGQAAGDVGFRVRFRLGHLAGGDGMAQQILEPPPQDDARRRRAGEHFMVTVVGEHHAVVRPEDDDGLGKALQHGVELGRHGRRRLGCRRALGPRGLGRVSVAVRCHAVPDASRCFPGTGSDYRFRVRKCNQTYSFYVHRPKGAARACMG